MLYSQILQAQDEVIDSRSNRITTQLQTSINFYTVSQERSDNAMHLIALSDQLHCLTIQKIVKEGLLCLGACQMHPFTVTSRMTCSYMVSIF